MAGRSRVVRVLFDMVESAIRNIGGGLGRRIRYHWYRQRFRSCGRNVLIDVGVIFTNPEHMELGDNVWINSYALLEAGVPAVLSERILKVRENPGFQGERGLLKIGSGVAIGAFNIVNGGGGVSIGDNVTTSAFVKIYSHSHHHRDDEQPERVTYANCMASPADISCIESPIALEDGCWLGLNVAVFGGCIGKNSFVATNAIVVDSLSPNSYAAGAPASRRRQRRWSKRRPTCLLNRQARARGRWGPPALREPQDRAVLQASPRGRRCRAARSHGARLPTALRSRCQAAHLPHGFASAFRARRRPPVEARSRHLHVALTASNCQRPISCRASSP